jgi:fermentation-respiration switch protein FrsA (DUF1100 family)
MKKLSILFSILLLTICCKKEQKTIDNKTNKKVNTMSNLKAGKNTVTFKSYGMDLAGDLYLPEGFDPNKKYKAIVSASPFPQVKEQVMATYGPEMAARGFVFLGFDYLGMGDSPALPGEHMKSRYQFRLLENTWDAVSYLGTLPFVEEINGLGVCQGGSTIATAAITDHRIKKIATISGMMASDWMQWGNKEAANFMINTANTSKQKMYETGKPDYVPTYGMTDDQSKEEFLPLSPFGPEEGAHAYDYYGRDGFRGAKAVSNFSNMHIADQVMQSMFCLAEHYADKIVQPTLVVYGTSAVSAPCSTGFIEKLTCQKEVIALEKFAHIDFYYKPDAVKLSADATAEFFNK